MIIIEVGMYIYRMPFLGFLSSIYILAYRTPIPRISYRPLGIYKISEEPNLRMMMREILAKRQITNDYHLIGKRKIGIQ
jgi:hypothetical protein